MGHRYTARELRFIKTSLVKHSYGETADMFNRRFGLSITVDQINSIISYYKLGSGRFHKYTAAEIRFLEKKVAGRSYAELTELFNRRFGLSITVNRLASTLKRLNLTNGRDGRFPPGQIPHNKGKKGYCAPGSEKGWFEPKQMPHNWRPVGTEIIDLYGYVKVKTRNPKTWKFKHRLIWEAAHGKIPRGHIVIFADGNKMNFDPDNLLLVSRAEHAVMNQQALRSADGDLTLAGKAVADIKLLIGKRKREAAKKGGRISRRGLRTKAGGGKKLC
jgi:hypothetical protein